MRSDERQRAARPAGPGRPTPELRTTRLRLTPLAPEHAEAYAAWMPDEDARRETAAAHAHWRAHGFGPWAVLERDRFVGFAEVHYAGGGIDGIAPDEVEAGWVIADDRRSQGLATEAMTAAIADAWSRARTDHLVAYIRPWNAASIRVAEKLGFRIRGEGHARSGDPATIYVLDAP
jgi:RimJ/RimL family protein N-acetyltransferase